MGFLDWLADFFKFIWRGFEEAPCNILMMGLDAAGKTTFLYRLKLADTVTSIPTIGFNVETVQLAKGINCTIWDVGGQERIRHLWRHFFHSAEGIVYVVDSSDRERLVEARDELYRVLSSMELPHGIPLILFANKQDLPNAVSVSSIIDNFYLLDRKERDWHVQGSCAVTGDGMHEGFQKLAEVIGQYRAKKREGKINMHDMPPKPPLRNLNLPNRVAPAHEDSDWHFINTVNCQ